MKKYTFYFEELDLCLFTCSFDCYTEFCELWRSYVNTSKEVYADTTLDMLVCERVVNFLLREHRVNVVTCSTSFSDYLITICEN